MHSHERKMDVLTFFVSEMDLQLEPTAISIYVHPKNDPPVLTIPGMLFDPKVHFLLIYICNFHVLSHIPLIYICKLHWN
jgi:hypothetical protein